MAKGHDQLGGLFAVHAAHALGRSMKEKHLTEALSTRKVIDQALGLVMERYQINDQLAFSFLVRTSQSGNTKLRDIAAQIVNDLDRRAAPPPTSSPPPGWR